MFVIPAGIWLGAPVPYAAWWGWNQLPVTLGNIVAGVLLTGVALASCFPSTAAAEIKESQAA